MKKLLALLLGLAFVQFSYAQSPQGMSYQSMIRNATGDLLTETTVGIQISILQGSSVGTAVYVETHAPMSNINGLVSLELGMGTPMTGTFADIDWSNGPYFIQSETDPDGGTTYSLSGVSELLAVPYALFANEAANASFTTSDNVTSNAQGDHATDDFVFGSPALDDDGDPDHDARMFFDKSKYAFRTGYVSGTEWDNAIVGFGSIAMGYNTTASGLYSTAMGNNTIASESGSTAMGAGTTASGSISTAMGFNTTASGFFSTAMGASNTASGVYSTAMGLSTTARSYAEVALGLYNTDYNPAGANSINADDRLFVLGNGTGLGANASDAMVILKNGNTGIGESNPTQLLHLTGLSGIDGIRFPDSTEQTTAYIPGQGGAFSTTANVTSNAAGSSATDDFVFGSPVLDDDGNPNHDARMFFDKGLGAFRVGLVPGTEWDNANVGTYSIAMGFNTNASELASTAMGYSTTASGSLSTAIGANTVASGSSSTAMGQNTFAIGDYSTAMGKNALATGINSLAMGNATTASGFRSTAMGNSTTASGHISISMGSGATASGSLSTAMGAATTASGQYSTAMGYNTTASGPGSTAMGDNTHASGFYSAAMGYYTTAPSQAETVIGSYNTSYSPQSALEWNALDRLFVIGNGATSNTPSDAMVVLKSGNVGLGTDLPTATLSVNGSANKTGGGSWAVFSDRRLKKDISSYDDGLSAVLAIDPVTFKYNGISDADTINTYVGVIAQELDKVSPYMINTIELDGTEYLEVDNSAMTYMLINAVKEQQEIIEDLQTENSELKAENSHHLDLIDANTQLLQELNSILKTQAER